MRKWVKLFETRHYVGNCVDSFDEDGDCIVSSLPWDTVSDLGYADENATEINQTAFLAGADVPQDILSKTMDHDVFYMSHNNIFILYDSDDDIHYFFC